jgi:hypothetical protein
MTVPDSRGANPPRPALRVWAIALVAGVAAGLLAWLVGEATYGFFQPRLYQITLILGQKTMQPTIGSLNAAALKNATLAFAILGGVTGLAMGIAGGLAGGSPVRGVKVGVVGLVAGEAVGALASLALIRFFFLRTVPDSNDLLTPILIHGGVWLAIGVVGAVAFAMGLGCARGIPRAIEGACVGALLASVVYHLLSASLFPDSNSTDPIAGTSLVRFLAMIFVTVLVGLGAARGSLTGFHRTKSPVRALD